MAHYKSKPLLSTLTICKQLLFLSVLFYTTCFADDNVPITTTPVAHETLQHIQELLDEKQLDEAHSELAQINSQNLPPDMQAQYILLQAQHALLKNDGESAVHWLSDSILDELYADDVPKQIQIHKWRADAFLINKQILQSAKERVFISPLLPEHERSQQNEAIWSALNTLSSGELTQAQSNEPTGEFADWLSLVLLHKNHSTNLEEHQTAISLWMAAHSTHPAATLPSTELALVTTSPTPNTNDTPTSITTVLETTTQNNSAPTNQTTVTEITAATPTATALTTPTTESTATTSISNTTPDTTINTPKIAVLLPLSGALAKAGFVIRDGLIAALYAQPLTTTKPNLIFIDSNPLSATALYQTARATQANFIIGPLEKEKVLELQKIADNTIPILALNYTTSLDNTNPFLYQFGLNPEDEAVAAADKAVNDKHLHAIAIIPEGEWGTRVLNAFNVELTAKGGQLIDYQKYTSGINYAQTLRTLLKVKEVDHTLTQHRQDVDFIFLLAMPEDARQIVPALTYNYANDIPVYATSNVYAGVNNPQQDMDLSQINFCDMPWILNNTSPLKQQVMQNTTENSQYIRLYALGIDSYLIYDQLGKLMRNKSQTLDGQTGELHLTADNRFVRTLNWATMQKGYATPMP